MAVTNGLHWQMRSLIPQPCFLFWSPFPSQFCFVLLFSFSFFAFLTAPNPKALAGFSAHLPPFIGVCYIGFPLFSTSLTSATIPPESASKQCTCYRQFDHCIPQPHRGTLLDRPAPINPTNGILTSRCSTHAKLMPSPAVTAPGKKKKKKKTRKQRFTRSLRNTRARNLRWRDGRQLPEKSDSGSYRAGTARRRNVGKACKGCGSALRWF
ncbi:hypothetical protein B0J12DRAFT_93662 [Macrophomina phaseolina]|uniref:Uncharacterized protein n=1 Tax=Macrophomina phaseolina TaxID=35725 RepID=A0ABQ8GB35_9PEZI|nr:hypothetical protein B0J12DRAFT_93662 [Macrophomina phaseolina]